MEDRSRMQDRYSRFLNGHSQARVNVELADIHQDKPLQEYHFMTSLMNWKKNSPEDLLS